MDNNEGSQSPNLAQILIIVFTVISTLAVASLYIKDWAGFDLNDFGDSKTYFLTDEQKQQQILSGDSIAYYQQFENVDLLNEAADSLSDIDSNHVVQVRKMVKCYGEMYKSMPKVYEDIQRYNKNLTAVITIIIILWVASLWAVRATLVSRAKQENASKTVADQITNLKTQVEELKSENQKTGKKKQSKPKK